MTRGTGQRREDSHVGWTSQSGSRRQLADQVVDRAHATLPGRAIGDLDAAGRQRPRADGDDGRHAEQLGVGELHARRFVAVVVQDGHARIGQAPVERVGGVADRLVAIGADGHQVGAVRSDLDRPGDALLVVMRLHDTGQRAAEPDPVRAHDHRPAAAVLGQEGRPERLGVLRPELEDVADLDPVREPQRRAAARAGVADARAGDVGDHVGREVAPDVDVAQVDSGPVRAGDQVRRARHQVVDDHDGVVGTDRRAVAGLHAGGPDLVGLCGAQAAGGLDRVDQLRLVDLVVAAHDGREQAPVAGDEEGRLGGARGRDVEQRRQRGDRVGAGRGDLLGRHRLLGRPPACGQRAICWFAAYPQASHSTSVSSPCSLRTMNSWATLPPIMPTSLDTAMARGPRRAKMRS